MAELYLARTVGIEGFEKLVVLKRILPQNMANQQFVSMFLNEARLAATLQHPNIAQVYDIGVEEGDYFFTMEYIHGEDLGRLNASAHDQGVPMALDAALPFEGRRHNIHPEVRLAPRPVSGVALMQM